MGEVRARKAESLHGTNHTHTHARWWLVLIDLRPQPTCGCLHACMIASRVVITPPKWPGKTRAAYYDRCLCVRKIQKAKI